MKELFKGYYRPTDEEFKSLWSECDFVFDANILLNIYRYSEGTRKLFIDTLEKLNDRIWLPYQAANEFHEHRLDVIKQQTDVYEKIDSSLQNLQEEMGNKYSRHPYIPIKEITARIERLRKRIKKELDRIKELHPDLMDKDHLLETITKLFDGRVGSQLPKEIQKELTKEGERRFEEKIPPGFKDTNKPGIRKYGDLVLWFQIIEKAKSDNKPIIFVTDDSKDDWWRKFKGETTGPHPALIQEMKSEANVDLYIYRGDTFIEYAQKYLEEEVNKDAIEEIKSFREEELPHVDNVVWLRGTQLADLVSDQTSAWVPASSATSFAVPLGRASGIPERHITFPRSISISSMPVFGDLNKFGKCTDCERSANLSKCESCGEYYCKDCLNLKIEPQRNILLCKKCSNQTEK